MEALYDKPCHMFNCGAMLDYMDYTPRTLEEILERQKSSGTAGIVKPTGKNKMGYLLYDTATQERIGIIRMYQDIGFSVREIKEIIDAPKISAKPILEKQLEKLKKERSRIEEQIEILYDLIQKR